MLWILMERVSFSFVRHRDIHSQIVACLYKKFHIPALRFCTRKLLLQPQQQQLLPFPFASDR